MPPLKQGQRLAKLFDILLK